MAWLSEQDIYLFREGTHATLYQRMGCQLRPGGGAHFAVWAPNAREISVIGDWNHWTRGVDVLRPRWVKQLLHELFGVGELQIRQKPA